MHYGARWYLFCSPKHCDGISRYTNLGDDWTCASLIGNSVCCIFVVCVALCSSVDVLPLGSEKGFEVWTALSSVSFLALFLNCVNWQIVPSHRF